MSIESDELCRLIGLSPQLLRLWSSRGYVKPNVPHTRPLQFSGREALRIWAMMGLHGAGRDLVSAALESNVLVDCFLRDGEPGAVLLRGGVTISVDMRQAPAKLLVAAQAQKLAA